MRGLRAAVLAVAAATVAVHAAGAQTWNTVAAARDRNGEQTLHVDVEFAAGTFRVMPAPEGQLYHADARYDSDRYETESSYDPRNGSLALHLVPRHGRGDGDLSHQRRANQFLNLALSPQAATTLEFRIGAAQADLDLGGLSLRSATLKVGASDGAVRFTKPNRIRCDNLVLEAGAASLDVETLGNSRCAQVQVSGGVGDVTLDLRGSWDTTRRPHVELKVGLGSVTIRVPQDLGVEIDLASFLVDFHPANFVQHGSEWISSNYDQAKRTLLLDVHAALGSVDLEWVTP